MAEAVPANGNGALPPAVEAAAADEPKKPFKPSYPFSSYDINTPQNAAAHAFLLGCVFMLGASNLVHLFDAPTERPNDSLARFGQALQSPRLGVYVALLATFHMLEYMVTAIWNPSKVTVRSFLIDDRNHNAAHLFALLEYLLEETFLPDQWLAYKHSAWPLAFGIPLVLGAQYLRSLAMITAASNFSHLIVYTKAPEHSLVRSGIYGWSRHPSYAAFFYWALGTQIFIANPISIVAFGVVLYDFFSHRIKVEEWYLVKFFGDDYRKYQKEVPSRIPFIR